MTLSVNGKLSKSSKTLCNKRTLHLKLSVRVSSAISSWDPVPEFSVPAALEVEFDPALSPIIEDEPSIPTAEPEALLAKKKRGGQAALRSELLGENPKEARSRIRENFPQGFYVCLSGKRSIRTVHRLGACYALPDIDYLRWSFSQCGYAQVLGV